MDLYISGYMLDFDVLFLGIAHNPVVGGRCQHRHSFDSKQSTISGAFATCNKHGDIGLAYSHYSNGRLAA